MALEFKEAITAVRGVFLLYPYIYLKHFNEYLFSINKVKLSLYYSFIIFSFDIILHFHNMKMF